MLIPPPSFMTSREIWGSKSVDLPPSALLALIAVPATVWLLLLEATYAVSV
jgi:hypothetical protein